MSEKRLKFNNIKLNKKEFGKSDKLVDLLSVDLDQIVINLNIMTKVLSILLVT